MSSEDLCEWITSEMGQGGLSGYATSESDGSVWVVLEDTADTETVAAVEDILNDRALNWERTDAGSDGDGSPSCTSFTVWR